MVIKGGYIMKWDVFISHASEDKEQFVIPLVETLRNYGVSVWFDKTELKVGDSLSKKIDEGLIKSNYGIIVISKDFMKKGWTDYELRSLLNKEINSRKVILPIWHNVTKKDIEEFSLFLVDKLAIDTSNQTINDICKSIIEVVRPDIYKVITNLAISKKLYKNAKGLKIGFKEFAEVFDYAYERKSKKQDDLSLDTKLIIKAIHEIFKEVTKERYEEIIEMYKYNNNPHKEALIELKNAIIYYQCTNKSGYSLRQKKDIYTLIQMISSFDNFTIPEGFLRYLNKEDIKKVKTVFEEFKPNINEIDSTILFVNE